MPTAFRSLDPFAAPQPEPALPSKGLPTSPESRPAPAAVLGAHSDNERDVRLLQWLELGGAHFPLRVATDPATGVRGALAVEDIAAGSQIARIPRGRVITYGTVAGSAELGFRCSGLSRVDGDEALALFLLLERARGAGGAWAPYLESLPDLGGFPALGWGEAEVERLRGSPARDLVLQQRFAYRYAHDRLAPPLLRHPRCPPLLAAPGALTAHSFAWAMGVQQTRATRRKGEVRWDRTDKALVAGMDLLNHSAGPEGGNAAVAWLQDGEGDGDPLRPLVAIEATRDIPAGSEVLLCYGDLPNFQLLPGFGFAVEGNAHDAAILPAPAFPPPAGPAGDEDGLRAARGEALRALGFDPRGGRYELLLWARKSLPHELKAYLAVAAAASAEELAAARAGEAAALPRPAAEILAALVEAALAAYPPPAPPPAEGDGVDAGRAGLAETVVEGERALLRDWLRAARGAAHRSPLDDLLP
eukprot:tig00020563_g11386.t1